MAKRTLMGFLSFLLFLSLSGFGLTFVANRTVLNPDFVISRLDGLDVTSLSQELLQEQVPPELTSIFPPQFVEKLLDNVEAFISHIKKIKPPAAKGTYIKKMCISATMSPGIRVDY